MSAASDRLTADVAALVPAIQTLISTANAAVAALRASAPAADDSAAENSAADALEAALGTVQTAVSADSIAPAAAADPNAPTT